MLEYGKQGNHRPGKGTPSASDPDLANTNRIMKKKKIMVEKAPGWSPGRKVAMATGQERTSGTGHTGAGRGAQRQAGGRGGMWRRGHREKKNGPEPDQNRRPEPRFRAEGGPAEGEGTPATGSNAAAPCSQKKKKKPRPGKRGKKDAHGRGYTEPETGGPRPPPRGLRARQKGGTERPFLA